MGQEIHPLKPSSESEWLKGLRPITYVAQQLGHADASITLRVYAHYLPDASRRDVDLLDVQPLATPAQPAAGVSAVDSSELEELFGESGEPRRNRTFNPQIKSLLLCQLS